MDVIYFIIYTAVKLTVKKKKNFKTFVASSISHVSISTLKYL